MTEAVAIAPDASDLCTSCALCCDGSLYAHVKGYPPDLITHAAEAIETEKGFQFPQPCPHVAGTTCTIYDDRFTTCRKFRCALLRKLDAGTVAITEARARVATARALLAKVEPAARTMRGRLVVTSVLGKWQEIADPQERVATARRHLVIVALEHHLRTHFRIPREYPPQSERVTGAPSVSRPTEDVASESPPDRNA